MQNDECGMMNAEERVPTGAFPKQPAQETLAQFVIAICIQRDTHDSLERRHEWKGKGASMACALQDGDGAKGKAQAPYSWSAGAMLPPCFWEWRGKTLSYQLALDKSLYSVLLIPFQHHSAFAMHHSSFVVRHFKPRGGTCAPGPARTAWD